MYFTLGLIMNLGLFFSKSDSFKKNIIINVVGETCFISRGAKKFSRQIWNDDRLGSKKLERAKLIYLYILPLWLLFFGYLNTTTFIINDSFTNLFMIWHNFDKILTEQLNQRFVTKIHISFFFFHFTIFFLFYSIDTLVNL